MGGQIGVSRKSAWYDPEGEIAVRSQCIEFHCAMCEFAQERDSAVGE